MDIKKIGKYTLHGEISRGGMGIVFHGMDEQLQRKHAVKMLPKEYFSNEEQKERFLQEARIIAKLDHPNIMKVYAYEEAEETVWIVMELLEGKLLSQLIKEKGRVPVNEACSILEQLAKALSYAHSKGIIHRDIKPSNVMVNRDGIVKLMDFGIARDSESDLNLTKAGTIMGTPKYMSPEQFTGEGVDLRTDVYSLGIMAYEMLCGNVPFEGKTLPEIAYKQIHEPLPPLRKKCPGITPELEKFIARSLAKKKPDRLAGLSDVNLTGHPTLVATKTARAKITVYRAAFAVLFLFILLTAGAYYMHLQQQKDENARIVTGLIKLADSLLKDREWLKAKGKLTQALALDSGNREIKKRLEEVSGMENAERNRNKAQSLFSEALKHLANGEMDKYQKCLDEASNLDPASRGMFEQKGSEELAASKKRMAKAEYDEGIKLGGNSEFDRAIAKLKSSISLDSSNPQVYSALAETLYDKSLFVGADPDYADFCGNWEKALELDPGNENGWRRLATAYSEWGDKDASKKEKARDACKRGISNFPGSDSLKNLLGSLGG